MKKHSWVARGALALLTLGLFALPTYAAQIFKFSASISPTSSYVDQTKAYTITITNDGTSAKSINSAEITIPAGVVIVSPVTSSLTNWAINTSATKISMHRKVIVGHDVDPGASFTVSFNANASPDAGTDVWSVKTWHGIFLNINEFSITSDQPSVSVVASPTPTPSTTPSPSGTPTPSASPTPTPTPVCSANETAYFYSDTTVATSEETNAVAVTPHPVWVSIPGAAWIWNSNVDNEGSMPEDTLHFTKHFGVSGTPLDSTLDIAVDNTYSVTVNGHDLATPGSTDANTTNFTQVNTWTIPAAFLVTGENTIVVTATNTAKPEGYTGPNPAGLIFKLSIQSQTCVEPTPTPTPTSTPTPTPTVTSTPTPTPTGFIECPTTGGFEAPAFGPGSVNGQDGWKVTGPYDQSVVANTYGYSTFGCQSLRVSDGLTSQGFGDWIFAKPIVNAVGEADATAGSISTGEVQRHFEAQFDIASTMPNAQQPGLHVSVSPDRGDGSRMSYLRFEDGSEGINVYFDDVMSSGVAGSDEFMESTVASNLDRTVPHSVKLTLDVVDGPSNDVVKVYIDGNLVKTGTSWEDYYRYDEESSAEQSPRMVNTLIIQARGTAHAENSGKGFLFDNVSLSSGETPVEPTPTPTIPNTGGGAPFVIPTPTPTPINGGGQVLGASTSTVGDGSTTTPPVVVVPINNPQASCPAYIGTYIKFGAKNNPADVKRLQEFLNSHEGAKLPVTGFYGPRTRAAVIKFQRANAADIIKPWVDLGYLPNIETVTGYVYKTTTWKINSILCPGVTVELPMLP